ncbi:MAG TPA: hypothetical protein VL948_01060, partial [Verrucomicrobiae bacterium]|nr:hypothetical protein [Verrucomicrobiae bacterium]
TSSSRPPFSVQTLQRPDSTSAIVALAVVQPAPTGTDGAVVAFQVAKTQMLYAKWQNWRKFLEDTGRQVAEKRSPDDTARDDEDLLRLRLTLVLSQYRAY